MTPPHATPQCRLESWDANAKAWVTDPTPYESIAAATKAATERGVYRVVVVKGERTVDTEAFAIV